MSDRTIDAVMVAMGVAFCLACVSLATFIGWLIFFGGAEAMGA